jgi:glutathionyl-hydroquinone reductase
MSLALQPEAKPALPLGHLFAVYSQPSSHQAILMRQLKGLQVTVPLSNVMQNAVECVAFAACMHESAGAQPAAHPTLKIR